MSFDLKIWQEKIKDQLKNWHKKIQRAGLKSNYAWIATATLWPVLAEVSAGNLTALVPLINLVGSAGTSVLVGQIKDWITKSEGEVSGEIATLVSLNETVREELDNLLEKFDSLTLAGQELPPAELKTFLANITEELKQLGNLPRFEATVRSIQISGSVEDSIFVTGDKNSISYVVNQYFSRNEPADAKKELQKQITNYLTWMQERCGLIELRGIKREGGQVVQLPLEDVYVPLAATVFQSSRSEREITLKKSEPVSITLDQVLKFGNRLIITGGPGSGKTTVLMHIAWILTQAMILDQAKIAENQLALAPPLPLPIFVPLSAYADFLRKFPVSANPHDRTLASFISRYLIEKQTCFDLPDDFFTRLLRKGQSVILLLDGLDEVPNEDLRAQVKQAIEDLVTGRQEMRVVVTCRTAAYKDRTALGKGFQEIRVQNLEFENVEALINQAYQHLFKHDAGLRKEKVAALLNGIEDLEAQRKQRLGDKAERLVTSPLIVRMLIVVHFSERKLPDQRAELLMKATDAMLAPDYAPDEATTTGIGRLVGGSREIHRDLAQYLAFAMHSRGETSGREISEDELKKILHENPAYQPLVKDFIALTRLRGTLLEERMGQYRFIHLSFQEYLTGRYLAEIKRNETGVEGIATFLEQEAVLDSWWREPILLAAGYLSVTSTDTARAFIQSLAGISEEAKKRRKKLSPDIQLAATELAASACLEWQQIVPESKSGMIEQVTRLMQNTEILTQSRPVRRAQLGNALALLGDPRPEVMTLEEMEFCLVPGGPFWMGAVEDDDLAFSDEKTLHLNKKLKKDYWISRFPVTNAQFRQFVADEGYKNLEFWKEAIDAKFWNDGGFKGELDSRRRQEPVNFDAPFNLPNHPVVWISWYEALAFVRWLAVFFRAKGLLPENRQLKLPSEAEWEKAARGGEKILQTPIVRKIAEIQPDVSEKLIDNPMEKRRYPWGPKIDANLLNYEETGIGATSTVGCFPGGASPCGCEEMSGNVWEWCGTKWRNNYEKAADESPAGTENRVLRGGACIDDHRNVRCSYRYRFSPLNLGPFNVGFRVVLSPYR